MDRLVLLPEEEATRVFFYQRNRKHLFRALLAFTLLSLGAGLALLFEGWSWRVAAPAASLALIRLLYEARNRGVLGRHFRSSLLLYLALQPLLALALYADAERSIHPADLALPLLALLFRLPARQASLPLGILWAATTGRHLVQTAISEAEVQWGWTVGQTAVTLGVLWAVDAWTRKQRRDFLLVWRRDHRRHRERTRMQSELDDARKIQLSMLPRTDPKLPWLDIAGISIPASEVGGDYFDYFRLSDDRFALTVADVSGHGVASGLILSGIRSCLFLLQEYRVQPVEVLRKLDRMVRHTTSQRVFVALLYALFDREKSTLTFSAAGHHPILCFRAGSGTVEEIGLDALPLGTSLQGTIEERSVPFQADDIFVFFTDGIAETANQRGDVYGHDRLVHRLASMPHDGDAKGVRDTLLSDVWGFKSDAEQTDDITLVVVKPR